MNPAPRPLPSRRTVLKGLAASLTLPWLPSLAHAGNPLDPTLPPRRFVTLSFGNGADATHWVANKAAGGGFELGPALAPLKAFEKDLTILKGLRIFDDKRDEGASGHCYYFANFLSGGLVQPGEIHCAESLDQRLAKHLGDRTALPSLHLGTEPVKTGTIFGAPAVCGATMSWRSATAPVVPEIQPQQVFDRLFNAQAREADRSVLDFVIGQTGGVRKQLALQDQRKLDQYLDSIRDLERRIANADAIDARDHQEWRPSKAEPDMERPASGVPASRPEHVRLLLDLLVLALEMDQTRIATCIMAQDVSNFDYRFLDGVSGGLHGLSHSGNGKGLENFRATNQWHSQQAAYLARKLASVEEANGSLLDNTMLLYAATMNDGNKHDPTDLTVALLGGRNCDITPGRYLEFTEFEDRRLCNLHTSIAQRMGLKDPDDEPLRRFGNAYHPIAELSA